MFLDLYWWIFNRHSCFFVHGVPHISQNQRKKKSVSILMFESNSSTCFSMCFYYYYYYCKMKTNEIEWMTHARLTLTRWPNKYAEKYIYIYFNVTISIRMLYLFHNNTREWKMDCVRVFMCVFLLSIFAQRLHTHTAHTFIHRKKNY